MTDRIDDVDPVGLLLNAGWGADGSGRRRGGFVPTGLTVTLLATVIAS